MSTAFATPTHTPSDLYLALQEKRAQQAPGYFVDWARSLNTSEGALQAARIGQEKVWPIRDVIQVLRALPSLGHVLAITRNLGVVHEFKGTYPEPKLGEAGSHPTGLFLDIGGLDLRLMLSHWYWGCAIEEETPKGTRRCLQFFDQYGSAVHKTFALEETDLQAWQALVEQHTDTSAQAAAPDFLPEPEPEQHLPATSPSQVEAEWRQIKDVHQFFGLLRRHRLSRFAALQSVPADLSRPVPVTAFNTLVDAAAAAKIEVMFFVGSRGCVQIYTGQVSGIKPMRGWLNLFEENFTLHANPEEFAYAFVTRKPQSGGWVSSLEVFNAAGQLQVQMYGRRDEGQPEQAAWTAMINALPDLN